MHNGHLFIALEAASVFGLEKVYFVPAFIPPHKAAPPGAPPSNRLDMTLIATSGEPLFEVSSIELRRKGRSYTIDTVRDFKKNFPTGYGVYFITGFDSYREFKTWKNFPALLEECRIVTAPRRFEDRTAAKQCMDEGFLFLDIPILEISSTDIRKRIRKRRPVKHLTPPAVADYIEEHKLYR